MQSIQFKFTNDLFWDSIEAKYGLRYLDRSSESNARDFIKNIFESEGITNIDVKVYIEGPQPIEVKLTIKDRSEINENNSLDKSTNLVFIGQVLTNFFDNTK